MREMTCFLAATLTLVAGCVTDAPIATEDAGTDASTCNPECPAPGPGCHYEGGDCTSCGTRVCDDGGASDAGPAPDGGSSDGGPCVECPAPPTGCDYEGASCATCGTLVCDVMCTGTTSTFPDFDRSCTDASECAVVEHQINCCGTMRALGIRADQQSAFDAAEASCRGMYPGCGCAALPTEADDGTTSDGTSTARAECVSGQCTSTYGLGNGDVCTPGGAACGAGLACCYPCGIPDCDYRCEPACDAGDPGCFDGCMLRP